MIGVFLLSLLVGFSGAIVPGPLFAVTIAQALPFGWAAGFWLSLGHMVAELALLLALRAGLGGLLQRPLATRIIGLIGGCVLLYFAWGMISVVTTPTQELVRVSSHSGARMSALGLVGQGLVLTVVNPYWYLWWATAGVGLISAQTLTHGRRAWPVFFLGHSTSDYVWYLLVSIILAISKSFMNDTVYRGLIAVSGIGIAILGVMFLQRQLLAILRTKQILSGGD